MGNASAFLEAPLTEKDSGDGESTYGTYGYSSMQGWRTGQEDAHAVAVLERGEKKELMDYFAVFDGHGGSEVSEMCARHLHEHIAKEKEFDSGDLCDAVRKGYMNMDQYLLSAEGQAELTQYLEENQPEEDPDDPLSEDNLPKDPVARQNILRELAARHGIMLEEGFEGGDDDDDDEAEAEAEAAADAEADETESALANGDSEMAGEYKRLKQEALAAQAACEGLVPAASEKAASEESSEEELVADEDDEEGDAEGQGFEAGSTSVTIFIHGSPLQVTSGWAGDSRGVLCRGGKALDLSDDHKPEDAIELKRITAAGSEVTPEGRVDGNLNLSRALGDFCHKQVKSVSAAEQPITAFPDTRVVVLEPTDEFIIVGCDGIWNSMTSQEAVDFVRPLIPKHKKISEVCEKLLDACMEENPDREGHDGNGMDNETAIIIVLNKDMQTNSKKQKKN